MSKYVFNPLSGNFDVTEDISDLANKALSNLSSTALNVDLNANTHKITNVVDPTVAQDAATKNYVDTQDALYIPLTQKAANNGVATLDAGGKIPAAQLPNTVMEFQGIWNASTNTPTLADGTGNAGDVYLVTVAGTQNLGSGSQTFAVGDWVVYSGTIWQKSINSNTVVSVNGQQGVVVVNAINELTGDATAGPATGSQSVALTLATVNSSVGNFGAASQVGLFTVDAKGRITAASNQSIQIGEAQVTNLTTDLAGKQATGNYITALTGDATASGPGSTALTLATVNSNVGTFGSATKTVTATVNAKGLVTAISEQSIAIPFSQVSGTVPIAQGGTGQTTANAGFNALSPMTTGGDLIYGGASGVGTRLANGTSGQFLMSNGGTTAPTWTAGTGGAISSTINTVSVTAHTSGFSANGTGTYTTPAGVYQIRVRMVGGGGGGAGSGIGAGNGTAGNSSTFGTSLLTAGGGNPGTATGAGGTGGTATISSPAVGTALAGGAGGTGLYQSSSTVQAGANGGNSFFGGGGSGGAPSGASGNTGNAGAANTGGGGGSGSTGNPTLAYTGSGGGAGGYVEALISSPAATYTYTVGASVSGGGAGTSGSAGGAGAAGYIEVTEYYANGAIGTATTITGALSSSNVVTAAFTPPTVSIAAIGSHSGGMSANGSGTYTTPTSPRAPVYITIEMTGGGGGGSASGTAAPTAATDGGDTIFGLHTATKGGLGNWGSAGGVGGGGTIGAGAVGDIITGEAGYPGGAANTTGFRFPGGKGGSSARMGAGARNDYANAGQAAVTNSGSGGQGGGNNAATNNVSGSGGGGGGTLKIKIANPAATYSYTVGAKGNGGTGGTFNGGDGGEGYIIVTEYYQ